MDMVELRKKRIYYQTYRYTSKAMIQCNVKYFLKHYCSSFWDPLHCCCGFKWSPESAQHEHICNGKWRKISLSDCWTKSSTGQSYQFRHLQKRAKAETRKAPSTSIWENMMLVLHLIEVGVHSNITVSQAIASLPISSRYNMFFVADHEGEKEFLALNV